MADKEHLKRLHQGVATWNAWRENEPLVVPDLDRLRPSGANLRGANLSQMDLSAATLSGAGSQGANLDEVNLTLSDLSGAILDNATLYDRSGPGHCQLQVAKLRDAELILASLVCADVSRADLNGANLSGAILFKTDLSNTDISGSRVHGVSAWNVKPNEATKQQNLVITDLGEREVTTDNIDFAQFLYLLLSNDKISGAIDAVTSKVILILGRFSDDRKKILDAIREDLRGRNLIPVLFDFAKPMSKDKTGTVETLARMARFIIADLTDPSSVPHELATTIPLLRTTPGPAASPRGFGKVQHV